MTIYNFIANPNSQFVNWNDPSVWAGGVFPDGAAADVIFPTITRSGGTPGIPSPMPYVSFVIIATDQSYSINSVSLSANYLLLNGTLSVASDFAILPGGEIDMGAGSSLTVASLENGGIDIQGGGQVNVTGALSNTTSIIGNGLAVTANSLNNTGILYASSGNLTVTTGSFSNLSASTLTGGTYGAGAPGGGGNTTPDSTLYLNVGSPIVVDAANIALDTRGAIASFDTTTQTYVPLGSSLQLIASSGSLSLSNQAFSCGTLTVDGKLALGANLAYPNINFAASGPTKAILSATQLIIDGGGQVSGIGTINAPVSNAGIIIAGFSPQNSAPLISFPQDNTTVINGSITGVGILEVGSGLKMPIGRSTGTIGARLELNGPVSQNVIFLDNAGTLTLGNPASFTGTIAPTGTGDQIVLPGVPLSSVRGYSYSGDSNGGTLTLELSNATYAFRLSGTFDNRNFALSAGPQPLSTSPPSLAITISAAQAPTTTPLNVLHFVNTGDTDANGRADIVYTSNGNLTLWQNTSGRFSEVTVPDAHMGSEWAAYGTGDFNNDGKADVLWTNTGGQVAIWELNGPNLIEVGVPDGSMGPEWHVAGINDFNGDGIADIFWVSSVGDAAVWTINGTDLAGFGQVNGHMGPEWKVVSTGDFDGDGKADALWESKTGDETIWGMNGTQLVSLYNAVGHMGSEWNVAGVGRFNGDQTDDIVWVDTRNNVQIWDMRNGQIGQIVNPAGHDGPEWHLKGVGDFTGSGVKEDLLWLTSAGAAQIWHINGTQVSVTSPAAPTNDVLFGL